MPRYVYRCTLCEELVTLSHLSDEVYTECTKCKAPNGLVKLLVPFSTAPKIKKGESTKAGKLTEKFIKSSRAELRQQKKELEDKSKE